MKKIILDQNNLKGFFSPVGPLHSHHEGHIWPYDYVDRGSDKLLVTIGDSWTWGSGIDNSYNSANNEPDVQKKFRLNNLYGNLISSAKDMNWLNLGFYAQGNQWIANKVFELRALEPLLDFKEINVMCILTSTGRWFYTWQDSLTNYKKFFQTNKMLHFADYEEFFINLNRNILQQIKMLTSSAETIKLLVGTNAVDHCGFDVLNKEEIIPQPWYQLLSPTRLDGISVDNECIKYLKNIENFLTNSDQKFIFQKWMLEKINQADQQKKMLNNMDYVSEDTFHPNYNGHRQWANYLLDNIL